MQGAPSMAPSQARISTSELSDDERYTLTIIDMQYTLCCKKLCRCYKYYYLGYRFHRSLWYQYPLVNQYFRLYLLLKSATCLVKLSFPSVWNWPVGTCLFNSDMWPLTLLKWSYMGQEKFLQDCPLGLLWLHEMHGLVNAHPFTNSYLFYI